MAGDGIPPGGELVDDPAPWDAWDPAQAAARLAGVAARWCVAAGWALELFRGEVTREHEDLEIAVPAGQFGLVRAAPAGFDLEVVGYGIPYLAPEIVLLFKARHARPKDQADFTGVLPLLGPDRQAWLRTMLARIHPGHTWLSYLQ